MAFTTNNLEIDLRSALRIEETDLQNYNRAINWHLKIIEGSKSTYDKATSDSIRFVQPRKGDHVRLSGSRGCSVRRIVRRPCLQGDKSSLDSFSEISLWKEESLPQKVLLFPAFAINCTIGSAPLGQYQNTRVSIKKTS